LVLSPASQRRLQPAADGFVSNGFRIVRPSGSACVCNTHSPFFFAAAFGGLQIERAPIGGTLMVPSTWLSHLWVSFDLHALYILLYVADCCEQTIFGVMLACLKPVRCCLGRFLFVFVRCLLVLVSNNRKANLLMSAVEYIRKGNLESQVRARPPPPAELSFAVCRLYFLSVFLCCLCLCFDRHLPLLSLLVLRSPPPLPTIPSPPKENNCDR
jgi:hypothetical protein